jgi:hypothetical protein
VQRPAARTPEYRGRNPDPAASLDQYSVNWPVVLFIEWWMNEITVNPD